MIARIWHGWTIPQNADKYETLLKEEIFVGIQGRHIRGFKGIQLLRREVNDEVEFITIMTFESLDAVRDFAGEDYEQAVVPEKARAVLSHFDQRSQHYEIRAERKGDVQLFEQAILVSVCSSLFHFINNSYEFPISPALGLFTAELLFSWVREISGGLWIPIGIHFAWDAASGWFNLLARQSPHLIMTTYTVPTWQVGEFEVND